MTRDARMCGALIGLAVGDALGTTLEFRKPGSFTPITDMVGGGPFSLNPGEWTDDTSMALCLAESLLERQSFDARDQMERYVRWWREGHLSPTGRCFDIGNTVKAALARYEKDGNPLAGSTDADTSGNGSLMRLAPVVMFYASEPRIAIELAGESSRTTHGSRIAIDACRYFAALLLGAFDGVDKETLLSPHYTPVAGLWNEQPLTREIANVANGSFRRGPPEVRGSGYVAQTLEAALWAFDTTADFRSACLAAANLGEDADTTAAVCGQIAGAYYGVAGIPQDWQERLAMKEMIHEYAKRLVG